MLQVRSPRKKLRREAGGAGQSRADARMMQLRARADQSGTVQSLQLLQRKADQAPLQLYTKTRADDGGWFIGVSGACHLHVEISKPHFKYGNDKGSRIDFGTNMDQPRLQRAYEELKANYQGKTGYADCIEYLEEYGCRDIPPKTLIEHGLSQGSYPPRLNTGTKFVGENGTVHTH